MLGCVGSPASFALNLLPPKTDQVPLCAAPWLESSAVGDAGKQALDLRPGGTGTLRADVGAAGHCQHPQLRVSDRDPCSPRVTLRRHRSLRKLLRDRGQLSHFWKAHRLDMVQYSEDCTAFTEANEPLINYFDVSTAAPRAGGYRVPAACRRHPKSTLVCMSSPQSPNASHQAHAC